MINKSPQTPSLSFEWQGTVVEGQKMGRTIDFPTANLKPIPAKNQFKTGVYAGYCTLYPPVSLKPEKINTKDLPCLVYFGPRYVMGEMKNCFEIYIYSFDRQIYNWRVEIVVTNFIRYPIKFSKLNELKNQLIKDKKEGWDQLQS